LKKPAILESISSNIIVIGIIARLDTNKGINFLIDAFAEIASKDPCLSLIIVGNGVNKKELEKQTEKLNLKDQVIFAGYQSEVNAFIKYLSIFVISSLNEALPLVLIEAMSHAKPIIATTVGGIPEVIIHLENGLLVPPANAAALTDNLLLLINDLELQKKLSLNARKTYETNFTVNRMLEETKSIYQKIIKT